MELWRRRRKFFGEDKFLGAIWEYSCSSREPDLAYFCTDFRCFTGETCSLSTLAELYAHVATSLPIGFTAEQKNMELAENSSKAVESYFGTQSHHLQQKPMASRPTCTLLTTAKMNRQQQFLDDADARFGKKWVHVLRELVSRWK